MKIRNTVRFVSSKLRTPTGRGLCMLGVAAAVAVAGATDSMAILPTEADTAVTEVATFVTDIKAAAWPIAASVTVGLAGIGLFKKFVGRAA